MDYKDLRVWQNARVLVTEVYRLCDYLPEIEKYGLESQMRRAVTSITLNIAEGMGRGTWKEEVHFLHMALGSANEVETQLIHCKDVGYFPSETIDPIIGRSTEVRKQLNRLIGTIIEKWGK
jgi:four helix bundle protein